MMKIFNYKIILLMIALLPFAISGCNKFDKDAEGPGIEPVKDLSGSWKVVQVVRNSYDMTSMVDFSKFTFHLNADNTYTLENYMPFMVKGNGTWSIDDPLHPYFFTVQENGSEPITLAFTYPVINGKRRIVLTTNLVGCSDNTYIYSLEKSSN